MLISPRGIGKSFALRPDDPGDETLRQIKVFLPGIKVLVITGEDDEEIKERVLGYGCDAYFNKADLSLAELWATVNNFLPPKIIPSGFPPPLSSKAPNQKDPVPGR